MRFSVSFDSCTLGGGQLGTRVGGGRGQRGGGELTAGACLAQLL